MALALAAPVRGGAEPSNEALLDAVRVRYELPAVAAAVVKKGVVVFSAAVGTRRAGFEIPVTPSDRFHIGSDGKAMTALVAATLVEQGRIRFESTVAEVFPELAERMDPRFAKITLEALLSHTSGLASDDEDFEELLEAAALRRGNLDEVRAWIVEERAPLALEAEPRSRFAYSNLGYVIAGAMLERVSGKTFEELVVERVFTPLGLDSAGFGSAARVGRTDAPLGHLDAFGKRVAVLAGPSADNPPVLGPAGTIHLSLLDFAHWAGWNAGAGRRGPALVAPEMLARLQRPVVRMPEKPGAAPGTPSRGGYGLGWGEIEVDWAAGPFLFHGGSNVLNLAHIWVRPASDFAMVLVTNIGGSKAEQALFELAKELYARFGETGTPEPGA